MKGPFSEASRSARGLTAGRRRRWPRSRGGAHAGPLRVTRVLSGCSLWGGRGNRDGWEGGLREVGDAGHASWLREKSGACCCSSRGPQSTGAPWLFLPGIILLFHIRLLVSQLPSVEGGENAHPCPGEVRLRGPLTRLWVLQPKLST